VFKDSFRGTELDFPSRVVVVAAWKYNVCVVLEQYTCEETERNHSAVDEGHVERHGRTHESGKLAETDTVIPHVDY